MATLPSERFIIQQIDGIVMLFEAGSEREIMRFDPSDEDAAARAQKTIHDSELSDEDKSFAHFWSGYFYAHTGASDPQTWQDQPDDARTNQQIYDELRTFSDAGLIAYVLPSDPLGQRWAIGLNGEILQFSGKAEIIAFLLGIQASALFVKAKRAEHTLRLVDEEIARGFHPFGRLCSLHEAARPAAGHRQSGGDHLGSAAGRYLAAVQRRDDRGR